ncbi:MAG TPA: DUF2188 domain-containing protein [Candidatus Deferrimicrobium sp.]|nr:DUF2188 domain-containing protein [Candidatus Kapabacteria bacterium]HLP62187.1 DUF2188 domain-containing protein [Candidatus Deferrimicrobium sp.]
MKLKKTGNDKVSEADKKERTIFHVMKSKNNWAIRKDGAGRAFRVVPLKEDAIKIAKGLNRKGFDLVIHRKDGTVEKWMDPLQSKKLVLLKK